MDTADSDDVAAESDGDIAGTVQLADGGELPVVLDADLVEQAQDQDVDVDRLRAAATPDVSGIDLAAQTDGDDAATVPVQDHRKTDLTNRLRRDQRDFQFIDDDQIRRLIRNSVNYTERVGRFLLAEDDLIPTVKERLKTLITGQDGLDVEPADAESDADQRLADHLDDQYGRAVKPNDVVSRVLRENLMNARAVLRATDLKELDLSTLDFMRDGVTGEEIYVQDQTTVHTFDLSDPDSDDTPESDTRGADTPGIDLTQQTVDPQPLVIGEHVFDVALYDTPPLEAIADTAINKMVLQRLKARKAEITSFGAVYASVEPPSYLPKNQYFDRIRDDDWDGDGQPPTKLEQAMRKNIQSAFDTLKDFQSGTVMSVPDFWTLEQLDVPETDDPIDDQIRGYNRDISRRLLVPLDLVELQSGSELSRETMFDTLMTTIAGWRREIIRVFDQYAAVQADIEGINGDVKHTFPPLRDTEPQKVLNALQYAGIAGLTEKEVRTMLNGIQGIDIDADIDTPDDQEVGTPAPVTGPGTGPGGAGVGGQPPDGGPNDADQRQAAMEQFLQEQQRGRTPQTGAHAASDSSDPPEDFPVTCRSCGDRQRIAGRFKCPACADDVDADGFDGDLAEAEAQDDDVDLSVPDAVQNAAQQALDARDDPDVTVNGMTDVGWSTAETLAAGDDLSPGFILDGSDAMAAWWSRHFGETIDTSGDQATLKGADADNPWADNSYTAGKGWGGVAGARFAFRKAAELTDGDAESQWRDWVDRAQARAVGAGNFPPVAATEAIANRTDKRATPLNDVPVLPDGVDELDKDALIYWRAWVASGRPMGGVDQMEARRFNPELHPRGQDGKFVERPWDIPDDILNSIDDLRTKPTADLLDELNQAGEPIDDIMANDDIKIDGIPDDINSVSDAKDQLGGDGLVFQDLEVGDEISMTNDLKGDALAVNGTVEKTEQVDGGPNQVLVSRKNGSVVEMGVPGDGSALIKRMSGPVKPPTGMDERDAMDPREVDDGQKVSVVSGYAQGDDDLSHEVTGEVMSSAVNNNGQPTVTIDGDTYATTSDNIQVFDAEPNSLDQSDLSVGDQVIVEHGTGTFEGEVESISGSSDYFDLNTEDGGVLPFDAATDTVFPVGDTIPGDDVDAETQDLLDEQGLLDADTDPADVGLDDVQVEDTVPQMVSDVEPDDWIVFDPEDDDKDAGVGQVSDVSGTGNQALVKVGDGGPDDGGVQEIELFNQDVLQQVPTTDTPLMGDDADPDVSNIEPSSVSFEDLTIGDVGDDLSVDQYQDLDDGDWVVYDDGDGQHAAKITGSAAGGTKKTAKSGHHSDPQELIIDELDQAKQIDPEVVEDVGDVPGVTETQTSTPADHSDFDTDIDIDDIMDNPNPPDFVGLDDVNHPVSPPDEPGHGVLSGQQAQALTEQLRDPSWGGTDTFEPAGSADTSTRPGDLAVSYPQADGSAVRDQLAHYANEVDGIPATNANSDLSELMEWIHTWKGSSYRNDAQAVEKAFHAGLNLPGPIRNDGLDGDHPSETQAALAAMLSKTTQQFVDDNFDEFDQVEAWGPESGDGELPLYRGVGSAAVASLVRDWAEDPSSDGITVRESKMGNYGSDPGIADHWATSDIVVKRNAAPEDIVMSPDAITSGETGIDDESEIWLTGGASGLDPDQVQIRAEGKAQGDGNTTLGDLPDDVDDLEPNHADTFAALAGTMKSRAENPDKTTSKYVLTSESQVDTFRQIRQRADGLGLSSSQRKDVDDIIDVSEQYIDQQAEQATEPAAT
jgi:hypothetical protein